MPLEELIPEMTDDFVIKFGNLDSLFNDKDVKPEFNDYKKKKFFDKKIQLGFQNPLKL
ncbi:MAG: hypothetical protein N2249_07120 [Melioribacter sp.]|nr:hypothetical protein [Melioribacter sp.]